MIGEERGPALERVLRAATDARGAGPLPWLAGPVAAADRVLDLACGTGPLADALHPGTWLGVDPRPGTERPGLVRADPTALPVRSRSVEAVGLLFLLPLLPDVDAVFAEVRRVLRPGGTLVVAVPSRTVRSAADLRLARVLRPVRRGAWPHRSACDQAGWLLAAADFAVVGDDRADFALPLPDAAAAHRAVADLVRA
ncbi:MAG TPA: methyltransferase domain-containing protein, partial [Pseudonocardia sp.]|nr:methyltransferase domain-containing protein [Pseudonocardia sp.]